MTEMLAFGDADIASGSRIPLIFAEAGLPAPSIAMTTIVGGGANSHDVVERMANLVLSLLPKMQDRGLVAPDEFDPETLVQQIADEVTASASFVAAGSEVTAYTRLPDHAAETS